MSTVDRTTPLSPQTQLLREREVAEAYGLSGRTIRRLVADGQLPRVRIGGSIRYRLVDVEGLITRGLESEHESDPAVLPQ